MSRPTKVTVWLCMIYDVGEWSVYSTSLSRKALSLPQSGVYECHPIVCGRRKIVRHGFVRGRQT